MSCAIKISRNLVDIITFSKACIVESLSVEFGIPSWNLHELGVVDVGHQLLVVSKERGCRDRIVRVW